MLAWLRTEAPTGRGTTGAIMVSCQGCKAAWRGSEAFMIVVRAFQSDMTECRREFYALSAKVKTALGDATFLEQLTRESTVLDRFNELSEQTAGNTRGLAHLEIRLDELVDELDERASEASEEEDNGD